MGELAADGGRHASAAVRGRGVIALLVLTASFALLTVLARYLNTGFTVAQQVYLRSGLACVFAVAAFGRRIRWRAVVLRAGRREWGVIVLRALLIYPIGTVLFSKAATMASVASVSFIAALPLVSGLGLLAHRATATRRRIAWVLGAAAGVAVLSWSGDPRSSGGSGRVAAAGPVSSSGWNAGDLIALVAMLAIAVGYITRPWHRPPGPAAAGLNNHEITVVVIGVGAASVAALSFLRGEGPPPGTGSGALWAAVSVAGVLSVLNIFLINYTFEHVEPVRAGNLLTLECVWGLFFGLVFFGQVPGLGELAGGAAIVVSAVGMNVESARRPTRPAAPAAPPP